MARGRNDPNWLCPESFEWEGASARGEYSVPVLSLLVATGFYSRRAPEIPDDSSRNFAEPVEESAHPRRMVLDTPFLPPERRKRYYQSSGCPDSGLCPGRSRSKTRRHPTTPETHPQER